MKAAVISEMFMMKKTGSKEIDISLKDYFHIITSNTSRNEALKSIAALGLKQFGEYITPGSLDLHDEVLINFVELLDQIIFELSENNDSVPEIRDYITDDLYSRFSLTIEALVDYDKYKSNLKNRPLYTEDLIVIRTRGLSEFVPLLISESEDITNHEKNIIKTLLYFSGLVHLDFFYNIFRNSVPGFIKSASLLGLKYCSPRGLNWDSVKEAANGYLGTIEYAEHFNTETPELNRFPENMDEMTFVILHLEKHASEYNTCSSVNWLLSLFSIVPLLNFENSWLNEVNISLSNILLNIDIDVMRKILKDEAALIKAMNFIDYLPRNIFNRLTGRLDALGMEFIYNLNDIIEKKKKSVDGYNSNILTYISWNSIESI